MLKYFLAAAALVLAGVPAAYGLAGNDSFTRDVPVRVPEQAQTATPTDAPTTGDDGTADHGRGEVEPGDDHGGDTPRAVPTTAGDDHGGTHQHAEPGDDHGGATAHAEPGDDHGGASAGSTSGSRGDTSGRDGGTVDDHGGSGSGSGSDGSGSGSGGGSDDGSSHG